MTGLVLFSLLSGISIVHPSVVDVNYYECNCHALSHFTKITSKIVRGRIHCSLLCDKILACRMFQYNRNNKHCSLFWELPDNCSKEERTGGIFAYVVSDFTSI